MDGTDDEKLLYCGLEDPDDWIASDVTMTITRTDETDQEFTCRTESSSFVCDPVSVNNTPYTDWSWEVLIDNEASVHAKIRYGGTTSRSFRCNVVVNEEASDSKLVYAEGLTYGLSFTDFSFYNGVRYMLHTTGVTDTEAAVKEKLGLTIYGDNAEPRVTDDPLALTFEITGDGSTVTYFSGLDTAVKYSVVLTGATVSITDPAATFTIIPSPSSDGTDTTFEIYRK
jgi:hypothetical protein